MVRERSHHCVLAAPCRSTGAAIPIRGHSPGLAQWLGAARRNRQVSRRDSGPLLGDRCERHRAERGCQWRERGARDGGATCAARVGSCTYGAEHDGDLEGRLFAFCYRKCAAPLHWRQMCVQHDVTMTRRSCDIHCSVWLLRLVAHNFMHTRTRDSAHYCPCVW